MPADAESDGPFMFRGYVSTLSAVTDQPPERVEQILGFNAGSLAQGYRVYELASPVELRDFDWKDRTRYSDGWRFDAQIGEYVQRQAELRAQFGREMGYEEAAVDARIRTVMLRQLERLNVRTGPSRIVKVVSKGRIEDFPDSPDASVPQWKLKTEKAFRLIADIGPGESLAG